MVRLGLSIAWPCKTFYLWFHIAYYLICASLEHVDLDPNSLSPYLTHVFDLVGWGGALLWIAYMIYRYNFNEDMSLWTTSQASANVQQEFVWLTITHHNSSSFCLVHQYTVHVHPGQTRSNLAETTLAPALIQSCSVASLYIQTLREKWCSRSHQYKTNVI